MKLKTRHTYPDAGARLIVARSAIIAIVSLTALAHAADEPACRYEAPTRTLNVALAGAERFKYVFNKGGAVSGIYDLRIAPAQNLVGPSFQGETTDRVIQWTYWNSRYKAPDNPVGSRDKRANVTMEGSFGEAATCEVIATPMSGTSRWLQFHSRIEHWFYANLDVHGQPNFETTSTYEVLDDGSLKLTRCVTRHPWKLKNIQEMNADAKSSESTLRAETTMGCDHLQHGSMTSYFEAWSPFDHRPLPLRKHGKGSFEADGYRFWKPQDLGGWAMAYGDTQAVAMVFGKAGLGDPAFKLQVSFNQLDLPKANLNILLPAVELTWPDDHTLTQILIIVPGSPADVEHRANDWADKVPAPSMSHSK